MLAEDVAKMKMFLMNSVSPSDMLLFCNTNCSAVYSRRDRSCAKVNVGVDVGGEADILRIGAWWVIVEGISVLLIIKFYFLL